MTRLRRLIGPPGAARACALTVAALVAACASKPPPAEVAARRTAVETARNPNAAPVRQSGSPAAPPPAPAARPTPVQTTTTSAGRGTAAPAAQQGTPAPAPAASRDSERDARWRQDLDVLERELVERHPDAFFAGTRADFDRKVAQLRHSIPAMTDDEVVVALWGVAASLRDGHTGVTWPEGDRAFRRLPIECKGFSDGVYVVAARPEDAALIGGRVLKVGTMTTDQALLRLEGVRACENPAARQDTLPQLLSVPEVLTALHIETQRDRVRMEVVCPDARIRSVELPALGGTVDLERRPPRPATPPPPYDLEVRPEERALILTYRACRTDPGECFCRTAERIFMESSRWPNPKLVVDLRDNPGGDALTMAPLFEGLKERYHLRGHVAVIVNGGTYSAAVQNAVQLQLLANAKVIGEPTGGQVNSFGDLRTFRLPNSGLLVYYPARRVKQTDEPPGSMRPDVLVRTTYADWAAGRDPAMATALKSLP